MLELIAALALQPTETAECALTFERTRVDGERVHVTADCPDDAPDADALQALADRLLGPVRLRRDMFGMEPPSAAFTYDPEAGAWGAAPQRLGGPPPRISPYAVERGLFPAACAVGGEVSERGRIRGGVASCRRGFSDEFGTSGQRRRALRSYERHAREWVEAQRFMPGTASGCFATIVEFNMDAECSEGMCEYHFDSERYGDPDPAEICGGG